MTAELQAIEAGAAFREGLSAGVNLGAVALESCKWVAQAKVPIK
jgi:hypothetical protein